MANFGGTNSFDDDDGTYVIKDRGALSTQTVRLFSQGGRGCLFCHSCNHLLICIACRWFHGYISAAQARERLQNEKAGTFLLRFSSVPPNFALDLQDGFRVRHWRLDHKHKERKLRVFKDEYESLQQVVDVHSTKPLRLASGSPAALLRECLSRLAWDATMITYIAEVHHRTGAPPPVVDTPWPPPADWNS